MREGEGVGGGEAGWRRGANVSAFSWVSNWGSTYLNFYLAPNLTCLPKVREEEEVGEGTSVRVRSTGFRS